MKTLTLVFLLLATSLYSQTYKVEDERYRPKEIVITDSTYDGVKILDKEVDGDITYYETEDRMVGVSDLLILEIKNGIETVYFKVPERKWLEKKEGVLGEAK